MIYRYRKSILNFLLISVLIMVIVLLFSPSPYYQPTTFRPFFTTLTVVLIVLYPYIKFFGKIIKHIKLLKYFFKTSKEHFKRDIIQIFLIFLFLIPFIYFGVLFLIFVATGFVNSIYQIIHSI